MRAAAISISFAVCCGLSTWLFEPLRGETTNGADLEPYRQAETARDACIARVERGAPCLLAEREQVVVERALVQYDEQLAAVPRFRYLDAWDRLQRFVSSGRRSPIPAKAVIFEYR